MYGEKPGLDVPSQDESNRRFEEDRDELHNELFGNDGSTWRKRSALPGKYWLNTRAFRKKIGVPWDPSSGAFVNFILSFPS